MAADLKFVELCATKLLVWLLPIKLLSRNRRLFVLLKLCKPSWTVQVMRFHFEVLSIRNFLAGTAIEDLFNADGVLIGGNKLKAVRKRSNLS
jgi:hypothetical protein